MSRKKSDLPIPHYCVIVAKARRFGWYWRLESSNGKTLAHSENYVRKRSAMKTAWRLAIALQAEFPL